MEEKNTELNTKNNIEWIIENGYETNVNAYIKDALEIFKNNALNFILFTFCYLLVASLMRQYLIFQVVSGILLSPLSFGAFIVANKIVKNKTHTFKNFFDGYNRFIDIIIYIFIQLILLLATLAPLLLVPLFFLRQFFSPTKFMNPSKETIILYALIMFILLVLIIVVSVLLLFSSQLLWFKNMGAMNALLTSIKIIRKKLINWIAFVFILLGINILGLMAFGIGLLLSIPVSMIAVYVAFEHVVGTEEIEE